MQLTNTEIHQIAHALSHIDPKDAPSPYKLGSKARYTLAWNLKKLESELKTVEEVRVKLVNERLKPGQKELDEQSFKEFQKEMLAVMEQSVEIPLRQVSEEDLDLGENQIPIGLVAALIGNVIRDEA